MNKETRVPGRAELSSESKPVAHMARAIEHIALTKAADAVTDQRRPWRLSAK